MSRSARVALAVTLFALLSSLATRASAQTLKLTLHITGDTPGTVRMVSGGIGSCTSTETSCSFDVDTGATVRIAASAEGTQPGRFSAGTGPAAGCSLSTCSFTMTAAAELTATFASGDGPVATLTIGGGLYVMADGLTCWSVHFTCQRTYLQGSTVHLDAGAPPGAVFTGYTESSDLANVCAVTSPVCDFTLTTNTVATPNFTMLSSFTVTPASAIGAAGGPAQQFSATGLFSGGSLPIAGKGSWSSAINLPFKREFLAAAALGGKIYALGGSASGGTSAASDVAVYNPGNIATWTVTASLLTPRAFPAAVAAGGLLYAIGGYGNFANATASVERYDPVLQTWTFRAPMSSPRYGLVAGAINGVIYAAGGNDATGTPVTTLEAYDPASDTWTQKAAMPAARGFVAGGVIDGILYVVGGTDGTAWSATVQAYDPATNTWTTKASMPAPLSGAASAVADGVLYVHLVQRGGAVLFAYDPAADAWTAKAPPWPRGFRAAAALDGIVYVIGGAEGSDLSIVSSSVDSYVDSLRWSSSAPAVARVDQTGLATPLSAGTATIVANVGGTTCGASCPTFIVSGPSDLSLDLPVNNTSVAAGSTFTIGGWALNRVAPSGTGVDAIHVYAIPDGGNAIFLGVAPYGEARADVGAIFGSQFTASGFTLKAGSVLDAGAYTIVAYAHNALTQQFDVAKSAHITLTQPVSNPFIAVDTPQPGQVVTSAFEVGGWALDAGAPFGTGVAGWRSATVRETGAVCFNVQTPGAPAPGVVLGCGSYGATRTDVGAIFGSRFDDSGYHFTITGLSPGAYTLNVRARSTVTFQYTIVKSVPITVSATALMSIDVPEPEATIATPSFTVGGWSIDRTVEGTALTGTGVDTLHVYAYPNPGSGEAPIFLGVATVGMSRPDVASLYGASYGSSGYALVVDRAALGLTAGVYSIAVHSHSAVTGTFNNVAVVRVTLQ